ncbi:MAG: methylenetetrahydrofolate reductase C-terminal domain-containing protein [bacterium]
MIITEKKPLSEILENLKGLEKVLLIGCGDCAALAQTGGDKELESLSINLTHAGKQVVGTLLSEGPCHNLRIKQELRGIANEVEQADAVVVLSCGAGVQAVADLVNQPVLPGLNSLFLGNVKRYGWFEEHCSTCGECIIADTGGICPVTRCAKSLVNGPCGGSKDGMCEVGGDRPCVWALIFERLKQQGRLELLTKYQPMKDFERSIKPGIVDLRMENQDARSERLATVMMDRQVRYLDSEFGQRNWQIKLEDVKPAGLTRLQTALEAGYFVQTAEIVPPKGVDVQTALEHARSIKDYVVAVNVNENPASVMRLNSLSLSHLFVREGIEPIFHITTRERNRLALQSELLGAYVLGIRNVLVLTGDHQSMGDHKEAKPVYDLDSVQLLRLCTEMMGGKDYNGHDLDGIPSFYLGAVVNPGSDLPELQILKMRKKALAGARYFFTQAVYDLKVLENFMAQIRDLDVKILAGIIPLKSAKMARFMNQNIPGINVPEHLIERMEKTSDRTAEAIAICRELVDGCRSLCHGVHIMPIGWYSIVPRIFDPVSIPDQTQIAAPE